MGKLVHKGVEVAFGRLIWVVGRVCGFAGYGLLATILDAVQKEDGVIEVLCSFFEAGTEADCRPGVL